MRILERATLDGHTSRQWPPRLAASGPGYSQRVLVLDAICLLAPAAQGRTPEHVEGRAPVSAQERIVPEPGARAHGCAPLHGNTNIL